MMDLRTLEHINRQATRRSQRDRKLPALVEPEDVRAYLAGNHGAIHLPYIGQRVPRGFRAVRSDGDTQAYPVFVDKSGFGSESEPAWTLKHFLDHVLAVGSSWWGTVEDGQFQVYVQRYEKMAP
mgnify:FL=1